MMMKETAIRDVVVIGGGLVGAAAAIMLRRRGLDVVVLESRERHQPQKTVVGEAITEGSSVFLRHELGFECFLRTHTFRKFGFDFLVLPRNGPKRPTIGDCHELLLSLTPFERIPRALSRLIPTYHVDRATINEEALRRAEATGVSFEHDATVREVVLGTLGETPHEIRWHRAGQDQILRARWVLDCSGRRRFLGRQLGITHDATELPTAAVWNRFEGVDDCPETWRTFRGIDRRRHTIHFSGHGFWFWWIHQNSGQTSVGVSYDRRIHQPDVKAEDRGFAEMVAKCPPVQDALRDAKPLEHYQYLAHLPYRSDYFISTRGYALIGDASWFADALYSTSLEAAFRQLMAVVPIVHAHDGRLGSSRPCPQMIAHLNEEFDWLTRSAIAHNRFKYEHAWHRPHTLMQVALYELGEISELYNLQAPSQWRPERIAKHYRLQWGSRQRHERLVRFMESAKHDGERDRMGRSLLKKSLSPGPLIYSATWPLFRIPGATPYFFKLTRAWGYAERDSQRIAAWPDLLSLLAQPHRPGVLYGATLPRLEPPV
jgi:flavin-dependent dehydrogenase